MKLLETISRDVSFALRNIYSNPGFALAAIISLCLGIGATTAVFGVLNALMWKPLPVKDPASLVEIRRTDDTDVYNYAVWRQIRQQQDMLADVFAYGDETVSVESNGERQTSVALYVSGNYFDVLGISPAAGRPIVQTDDVRGAAPVCVISYGLWQRRYGKSKNILGTDINVNGHAVRIVGIAPRGFFGVMVGNTFDLILPLESERLINPNLAAVDDLNEWWLMVGGRLKPGTNVEQASARLQTVGPWIFKSSLPTEAAKSWHSTLTLEASSIANGMSDARRRYGKALLLMMAMATVLLGIVCANLANLLLARSVVRRKEIATRLALGATRGRLIQQLLTESIVLCLLGTAAGLAVGRSLSPIVVSAISTSWNPTMLDLSWNWSFASFAILLFLSCSMLFGWIPAMQAANAPVYSAMKGIEAPLATRRWLSGRTFLLVSQVALSLVAAISAGLLVRTFQKLVNSDLGYDPKGVLVASTAFNSADANNETIAITGDELLQSYRATPGILAAARLDSSTSRTMRPNIEVANTAGSFKRSFAFTFYVSTGFFAVRRTPISAGRDFTEEDGRAADAVAILSAAAANLLFPGRSAIGATLVEREGENEKTAQPVMVRVVGIAKDINFRRPGDPPLPVIYRPLKQCVAACPAMGRYELRFRGQSAHIAAELERSAVSIDPRVSVDFRLLSDESGELIERNRSAAAVALLLGVLSTILATIGIYGITSYSTSRRRHEVGVRMALGAQSGDIIRMILTETLAIAAVGIGIGLAAGYAVGQAVRSLLFGIPAYDPATFLPASALIIAVAVVAAFVPSFAASRLDPLDALRAE